MGPYNIPRNVKDEGRILFIFTGKSMGYTVGGALIGSLFYFLFSALGMSMVGVVIVAILALIGFTVGTLKMPSIGSLKFSKTVSGENVDELILRAVRFKQRKNRIYINEGYEKEEVTKDE